MRWWTMYPMDVNVRFDEALLFLDQLGELFDLDHLSRYVQPYRSETEDGERTSEWAVDREGPRLVPRSANRLISYSS